MMRTRRPKLVAWGVFCPTCRTVRSNPLDVYVFCEGASWDRARHPRTIIEVVDLFATPTGAP